MTDLKPHSIPSFTVAQITPPIAPNTETAFADAMSLGPSAANSAVNSAKHSPAGSMRMGGPPARAPPSAAAAAHVGSARMPPVAASGSARMLPAGPPPPAMMGSARVPPPPPSAPAPAPAMPTSKSHNALASLAAANFARQNSGTGHESQLPPLPEAPPTPSTPSSQAPSQNALTHLLQKVMSFKTGFSGGQGSSAAAVAPPPASGPGTQRAGSGAGAGPPLPPPPYDPPARVLTAAVPSSASQSPHASVHGASGGQSLGGSARHSSGAPADALSGPPRPLPPVSIVRPDAATLENLAEMLSSVLAASNANAAAVAASHSFRSSNASSLPSPAGGGALAGAGPPSAGTQAPISALSTYESAPGSLAPSPGPPAAYSRTVSPQTSTAGGATIAGAVARVGSATESGATPPVGSAIPRWGSTGLTAPEAAHGSGSLRISAPNVEGRSLIPGGATLPSAPYQGPTKAASAVEGGQLVAGTIVDGFKVTPALIARLQAQAASGGRARPSENQPPPGSATPGALQSI